MAKVSVWVPDSAIQLAAAQPGQPRPGAGEELGATGSEATAGELVQEDYNVKLRGLPAYEIYDRMRFSDSSIGTGLWVIKLPLLRATWTVEPPTDTPKDREIAEFVDADLLHGKVPWQETLWQMFLMLDYGSYPFEIVWEVRKDDHRVHLRKLAPRHPKTITKWLIDDHGGFNGVEQQTLRSSGFHTVTIPPAKLIVYVNQKEGANFRGVSLLRRCYKHFTIKERLENVDAVAKEKRSMGIDVGTIAGGGGDVKARRRDLETALMTLHGHQKNFLTEIAGQSKYRIEGLGGAGVLDPLTSIEYHDLRCLRALLVEFLAMTKEGLGGVGAHSDKTSFFIMALGGIGENVIDTTGAFLIRKMVDINFGPQEQYPELRHTRLETRQTKELAEAVERFVKAGVFTPRRDDEEEIRRTLDFPDLPEETEEEAAEREEQRLFQISVGSRPDPDDPQRFAAHPRRRRRRRLTPAEQRVDFAALAAGLDDATEKIVRSVRAVRLRQVKKLVELGEKVIRARDSKAVEDIGVPFKAEIASATTKVLIDLFLLGRREAARELRVQGMKIDLAEMPLDPFDVESARRFLGVTARSLANLYGDALKATFTKEMLRQIKDGLFSGPSLEAVLSGRSERVVRTQARETVSTALNLGRQTVAEQHQDDIREAIFSSVLDSGTCAPCNDVDGRSFSLTEPDFEEFRPPYRECEGAGFCRCVYAFVLREEGGSPA